ncbi:hypothetical protein [Nocardia sp. CNY236]|uniref:hypothetical protein n=1 Tax=Nocardia sp. CNY236 TaxID=1169152 RepID=UPI00049161AB|nr:hypothetical protein [Nocardia sp. CNY236]
MFTIAAVVPSPPILVPQLCGGVSDGAETSDRDPVVALRAAVFDAMRTFAALTSEWMVIGTDAIERTLGPQTVGTFRGFGVDVRVGFSAAALAGADRADPQLPLGALIAGWLRGRVAPSATVEARIVSADAAPQYCHEYGAKLRVDLDRTETPRGVLVVVDGAATLSTTAPGYLDDRAQGVQDRLDLFLSRGNRAGLGELDPRLCTELVLTGRAAYQVLAGLFRGDPVVDTRYRGAPFGVGYHVALWRPAGDDAR